MRIKFFLSALSTLALLSTATHAYESWPKMRNTNFLVGGGVGYLSQEEDFQSVAYTSPLGTPFSIEKQRISDTARSFNLLAGWQWHCYRWLAGVEADITSHTLGSDHDPRSFAFRDTSTSAYLLDVGGTLRYHRGPMLALTGRLGWFFTPGFLPYIRAGVQVSRDEGQYKVTAIRTPVGGGGPPGPSIVSDDYASDKQNIYGFVGAFGLEFPTFIGASTLRFEYKYVRTEQLVIEDRTGAVFGTHRFQKPETSQIGVVWVWNFV